MRESGWKGEGKGTKKRERKKLAKKEVRIGVRKKEAEKGVNR